MWITLCSWVTTVDCFQVSLSSLTFLSKFSAFAVFFAFQTSHFSTICVLKSSASCKGYVKHLSVSLAVDLLLPKPRFFLYPPTPLDYRNLPCSHGSLRSATTEQKCRSRAHLNL